MKILIVMPDMNTGGAQRSLVSLFHTLTDADFSVLDITLALFKKEGQFLKFIPSCVNIIEVPCNCSARNGKQFARYFIKKGYFIKALKLLLVLFLNQKRKFPGKINQLYWRTIKDNFPNPETEYDVAIGYIDTIPTWYVTEKVKAKRKISFNRNDYKKLGSTPEYDKLAYHVMDKILAVSEECRQQLIDVFPDMTNKFGVFRNITNGRMIRDMATLPGGFQDDFNGIRILTVARTSYQKGIDIAYEAAKLLKARSIDFKWYILGRDVGDFKGLAEKEKCDSFFVILDETDNPYPFMDQCNLYVQPSRWEGRCNTIIEAKILGKPIVSCQYPTVGDLLENKKDGLLTVITAEGLADGIMKLIKDPQLAHTLSTNAAADNLTNTDQLSRFYNEVLGIVKE